MVMDTISLEIHGELPGVKKDMLELAPLKDLLAKEFAVFSKRIPGPQPNLFNQWIFDIFKKVENSILKKDLTIWKK